MNAFHLYTLYISLHRWYKKSWKIPKGGNQNPQIKKGQTTQWPKEKVWKDKQRSTKHTHKNRSSNTNLTKNREWTQVVTFSVVDYELEPLSGLYNVYLLLTSNHADLRTKSKDWIAWNQDNVSKWSEMSTCINCCFSELAL
jgi:hypothetical protein